MILSGCGGGGSPAPDSRIAPVIAILWHAAPTRLEASSLAKSARVTLTTPDGEKATLIAVRPDPVPTEAVQHQFTETLVPGLVTLKVSFYSMADATGPILGTASGMVNLLSPGNVSPGTLTLANAISSLSISDLPDGITVGESFTPQLNVGDVENQLHVLTAFPHDSIEWHFDESLLQRNGEKFTAIGAGQAQIKAAFTLTDGSPSYSLKNIAIQSVVPAGIRHIENFVRLGSPQWQNQLVGLTLDSREAVLLDIASGHRTQFPLPVGPPTNYPQVYLDKENSLL